MAHMNNVAQRIGIDSIAMCGAEADCTFFDEYNFEGLLNEPWYDRMKGNEMRSLFHPRKKAKNQQKSQTPDSC